MNEFGRKLKNTALVIGGFFVILFGYTRIGDAAKMSHNHFDVSLQDSFNGIANADAGCGGDSGDSGGDSGCK
jgi:hypothetical protein